jgi:predicted dehydrogenase
VPENGILGYAVIGCGIVSERHIKVAAEFEDTALRVLCDSRLELAETMAEKYPGARVETDYRKALDHSDVDVAVICLPTFLHEDAAIAAAKRGKHIFLEKPFALTVQAAKNIIAACEQNNVKLFVGHSLRYMSGMQLAKDILSSGKLGKIFKARATNCNYVNYDQETRLWKRDPDKDFGVILNIGIHSADFLRYILDKEPVSVYAHTWLTRDDVISLPDNGCALIQFEDDISVTWEVSESQLPLTDAPWFSQSYLRIHGTRGVINVDLTGRVSGYWLDDNGNKEVVEHELVSYYEIWDRMHRDFISCIKADTSPIISGYDTIKSLALIEAILESGRKSEKIIIN